MKKLLLALTLALLPLSAYADVILCDGAACANKMGVDATSNAARMTPYDATGANLAPVNNAAIGVNSGGAALSGKNYKLSQTIRATPDGSLAISDDSIMFFDNFEGTTRNLMRWVETATTQVSAQTVAVGLTLNSGGSTATTTGVLESSHYQIPLISRSPIVVRFHLNFKGATNALEEWGLSDQTSATTALHNNGVFFRRDGAGSVQPVIAFNGGTEAQGTVMTAPSTTEYGFSEIMLDDGRATFSLFSHTGTLLSSQIMEIGTAGAGGAGDPTRARFFAVTHLPIMMRTINTGAAGTAPQILVNSVSAYLLDNTLNRPVSTLMSAMGLNSLVSPTVYTQLANYANSAAPASATLSNTAAGYTTLGGQYQFAAQATNETDFALFGWQNPSPYTFFVTGVRIGEMINTVAAVGATPSVYQWGVGFDSSAVSLATAAPYSPMKVALGYQSFAAAAAIGSVQPGISWVPGTPMPVHPGKFLHVILKQVLGLATATEIFRGAVVIDGYFE
jgi:hypothetical protein